MDGWKKERVGTGRYMVYGGDRDLRIGFVSGGRGRYCAERGLHTVGYFPTVTAACAAIHAAHVAAASAPRREYVVWGIAPGETEETILYTKANSLEQAQRVAESLGSRYGCLGVRVQTLGEGETADAIAGMFRAAVNV